MRSRRRKALRSPTTASGLIETDEEEDNEKVDSLLSFIGFVFAIGAAWLLRCAAPRAPTGGTVPGPRNRSCSEYAERHYR